MSTKGKASRLVTYGTGLALTASSLFGGCAYTKVSTKPTTQINRVDSQELVDSTRANLSYCLEKGLIDSTYAKEIAEGIKSTYDIHQMSSRNDELKARKRNHLEDVAKKDYVTGDKVFMAHKDAVVGNDLEKTISDIGGIETVVAERDTLYLKEKGRKTFEDAHKEQVWYKKNAFGINGLNARNTFLTSLGLTSIYFIADQVSRSNDKGGNNGGNGNDNGNGSDIPPNNNVGGGTETGSGGGIGGIVNGGTETGSGGIGGTTNK